MIYPTDTQLDIVSLSFYVLRVCSIFMVYHPVSLYTKSVTHSLGQIVRVASYMGMELYRTYRITLQWAQFN